MRKPIKIIILTMIIVTLVGFIVFMNGNNTTSTSNSSANKGEAQDSKSVVSSESGITLEEFSKHNSKDDCWVIYKDKVYDLTSWIEEHPGGENAIARQCGTQDFEDAFIKKHGNSKATLFMEVAKFIGDIDLKGNLVK